MSIKYQQGDVLLVAVTKRTESDIRSECKIEKGGDKEGKVILALCEATGHQHRFELNKLDPGVTVSAFHGSVFVREWGLKCGLGGSTMNTNIYLIIKISHRSYYYTLLIIN